MEEQRKWKKAIAVFTVIVALSGLGYGLSDTLFANYFRDAYQVDAFQRGLIEVPRELPGVLSLFILSALAFWGDKRLALLSFALIFVGIMFLALFAPSFPVMLIFLFITSLGMHMFIPLYDNIGMSLAQDGDYGKILGRFNAIRTTFALLAAVLSFIGFRIGFFSFTSPIIVNFLIAGVLFAVTFCLIVYLMKLSTTPRPEKSHFVFRREYSKFYLLAILFGGRKPIIFVFGPWVLIELFDFGADAISLTIIAASIFSIFSFPIIGRWIDKYGAPQVMIIEIFLFFVIYLGYGIISAGMHGGWMSGTILVISIVIAIHILDRIVFNFGMVRSIYLRSIAVIPDDVVPTLATGMALDHAASILVSLLCGWLWWNFGPQYVFVFSGILGVGHLIVAQSAKRAYGKISVT